MHAKLLPLLAIFLISASSMGGFMEKREAQNVALDEEIHLNEEAFDALIRAVMKLGHMPSISAAIIKDDELVWAKGYGTCNIERGINADVDTIYLVASISKTFTATAIMQLQEKGMLNIDDDVNKYLPFSLRNPNYPDKPITIRMLLSHTSSLNSDPPTFYAYIPGDPEIEDYPYPWLKEYLLPDGSIYIPQVWADYAPGEEMRYANVGYGILGYVVERVSDMSFDDYCRENIFEPLHMYNSSFRLSRLDVGRVATPYMIYRGDYYPLLQYGILVYPAGGLRTTVEDLSHFLIAHMNGGVYDGVRILNEESVEEMHSIQAYSGYSFDYGLGFQIWHRRGGEEIGHTGGLYGVATIMVFRDDGVGIIFFTNKEIDGVREMIAFSLLQRLLFWKASGYDMKELSREKIMETVIGNMHMLKNGEMEESYLGDLLDEFLSSMYQETMSSTVFFKS